jgi:hypothetical protein
MPSVAEMIQSRFLRKEDIEDDIVVTIKNVMLEDMPGDEHQQRWVLAFKELERGLVLNSTTIRVLEKTFGRHTDQWLNGRVTLYVDPNVAFKGQIVGGLRVRPHTTRTAKAVVAALTAQRRPPAQEDLNDDLSS